MSDSEDDTYSDFEFELDDKDQRVLVQSLESNLRVYLRFTNKTSRPIQIWWRDFRGHRKLYVTLEPRSGYNINSFVTHPWQFTDAFTAEPYVINNKVVFRPPPRIGGMNYRINWNITIRVRTLRATAMLTLGQIINEPSTVDTLTLPTILGEELKVLIGILNGPRLHQNPEAPAT